MNKILLVILSENFIDGRKMSLILSEPKKNKKMLQKKVYLIKIL